MKWYMENIWKLWVRSDKRLVKMRNRIENEKTEFEAMFLTESIVNKRNIEQKDNGFGSR